MKMIDVYNDDACISDLYKDVYGIRPRHYPKFMEESEFDAEYEMLCKQLEENNKREAFEQSARIDAFEKNIQDVIECGAGSREKALNWIRENYKDDPYGDEYIEYDLGLPYGYLKNPIGELVRLTIFKYE